MLTMTTNNAENYNIICLSNQLWDFPNWTNKRHVMLRLARLGHMVLFVDPPINVGNVFYKQLKRGLWTTVRLLTQQKTEDGLKIYTPLNLVPFTNITSSLHVARLKGLMAKYFNPNRKTILWIYHVEIAGLEKYLAGLKYDLLVYDCVDNYSAFPAYNTLEKKHWIDNQEEMLAKRADVIFTTAPGLVEKMQKYNSAVHFTPNVGDYEKYKDADKLKDLIPTDIKELRRPRVGFWGALDDYKFDAKLVKKVALDHPDYSIILIGQIALKDKDASLEGLGLSGLPNIHFLGERSYKILENYAAGFDAFIIPYQLNDYTVTGCFPIKFHEALAAGLPTVVTNMPAYLPFSDVCYISKDHEEFSANLELALNEDNPQKIKARKEVAKNNNWDGKVAAMLNYIDQALAKKETTQ